MSVAFHSRIVFRCRQHIVARKDLDLTEGESGRPVLLSHEEERFNKAGKTSSQSTLLSARSGASLCALVWTLQQVHFSLLKHHLTTFCSAPMQYMNWNYFILAVNVEANMILFRTPFFGSSLTRLKNSERSNAVYIRLNKFIKYVLYMH